MTMKLPEPAFFKGRDLGVDAYTNTQLVQAVRDALEVAVDRVTTLYESDDYPYLPDITRAILHSGTPKETP